MRIEPIPVVSGRGLTAGILRERSRARGGAIPLLVTDIVDAWPATSTWDFELLGRQRFRRSLVEASAPQCEGSGWRSEDLCTAMLTFGDYLRYVADPRLRPNCIWVRGGWDRVEQLGLPLYAGNVDLLRLPGADALLRDVDPTPGFVDDWSRWFPRPLVDRFRQCHTHAYLYVAPAGALTPLHYDFWDSHAYLAQIRGTKQCVLFGPHDSEAIEHGEIDPEQPDYERFPLLREATAWTGRLEPGQLLLVPPGWWHHVRTLTPSITFSYNWFDLDNWREYLEGALFGEDGVRMFEDG